MHALEISSDLYNQCLAPEVFRSLELGLETLADPLVLLTNNMTLYYRVVCHNGVAFPDDLHHEQISSRQMQISLDRGSILQKKKTLIVFHLKDF